MKPVSRRAVVGTVSAAAIAGAAVAARQAFEPGTSTTPTAAAHTEGASRSTAPQVTAGQAGALRSADVLVFSTASLSKRLIDQVRRTPGVESALTFALGQVSVQGQLLVLASVDPGSFRNFTPAGTAQDQAVWERVALGQLAVDPGLRQVLPADDVVRLGASADAPNARIGAFAPQVQDAIQIVGSPAWADKLGMQPRTGLLVSTGATAPDRVVKVLQRLAGPQVSVERLDVVAQLGLDPRAVQTASVVGSVADAIGRYTYSVTALSAHGDEVRPDPAWVADHIGTETVPIIGPVTGNRLLFPQLKAALNEVVDRGLAGTIIKSEYGGAYYPRFIAGTHTLSNHAFGLAIDLNVAQNQRGTAGQMNRTVVSIFNRWGFTWGGTWRYTDPMHFEINRLVAPDAAS